MQKATENPFSSNRLLPVIEHISIQLHSVLYLKKLKNNSTILRYLRFAIYQIQNEFLTPDSKPLKEEGFFKKIRDKLFQWCLWSHDTQICPLLLYTEKTGIQLLSEIIINFCDWVSLLASDLHFHCQQEFLS